LTLDERVAAVRKFGFTTRQARFLDVVMRHAGVCLLRQYSALAGIVHGQKTRAFFAKLVQRGYASAHECRHNRGRVYHLHHQPLYRAIGEPQSRYRRPVSARRITDRLAVLDAVLAATDVTCLASGTELQNHLQLVAAASSHIEINDGAPVPSFGETLCQDALRLGVDRTGGTVALYVVMPAAREDLRAVLARLAPLLNHVPRWTLRVVLPRQLSPAYDRYVRVVQEEWEMPRFDCLYRRWLRVAAGALNDATTRLIAEALTNGSGRVECVVLNHTYDQLSPVIDKAKRVPVAFPTEVASPPTARSISVDCEPRSF